MPLILRVGGVAQALLEHVGGVIERAHHRRVIRDVQHVDAIRVSGRVHHPIDRLGVVQFGGGEAEGGAHRVGDDPLGAGGPVAEPRDAAAKAAIEFGGVGIAGRARAGERQLGQRVALERVEADLVEEHRVDFLDEVDHRANHHRGFVGHVAGVQHPVQAVQHDARDGVHHRGEGADRNHVARGLDRLLFRFTLDRLQPGRAYWSAARSAVP